MNNVGERLQDRYWHADRLGGALRLETHYDARRMRCFSERPETLGTMFADLVQRFPTRSAIIEDRALSYAELDGIVAALSADLAAEGITRGDRVALFLGNCWEFLAAVLACVRLGAIVVPIGTRQRRAELEFLLNDCGVKALIFEAELAESVPPPEALTKPMHRFAARGEARGARRFAELLSGGSPPIAPAAVSEEDTAVILYTSGTTGRPKGARLTHLGIIHSALTFARCFGLDETDRGLVAVPLSHVTGLVGVSLATMIVGGAVVLMRQAYKTPDFLARVSRERISYAILVPAIYTLCAMSPELGGHDLSAWRIGCFGGAPMPVSTIERLAQKIPHLRLVNAYGATETTSPTTVMPLNCWRENPDSVGQVVPCGELRIVDEAGNDVPPGAPGEIWIRGAMVVKGYWKKPEANAASFTDGFWHSGDVGSLDAEGFLRVFDRIKDMINRGGYKVFSAEVENALAYHPAVAECAVVGRPDPVLGERVCAFVLPKSAELTAAEIRRFCAERMADYKVPELIELVQSPLPRNANGKLQKARMRSG